MRRNKSAKSKTVLAKMEPKSLQQCSELAVLPPLSPRFAPMSYYRSVDSLFAQAQAYLSSSSSSANDDPCTQEQAYILLLKAAKLAVEQLPQHPDFARLNMERRRMLREHSKQILDTLGPLKKKIQKRREAWERDRPAETVEAPSPAAYEPDDPFAAPPWPDKHFAPERPPADVSLKRRTAFRPSQSPQLTTRPSQDSLSITRSSSPFEGLPPSSLVPSRQESLSSSSLSQLQTAGPSAATLPLPGSADEVDLVAQLPAWRPFDRDEAPSRQFDRAHQTQQGFAPAVGSIIYPPVATPRPVKLPERPPKEALQPLLAPDTSSKPKEVKRATKGPTSSGLRTIYLPESLIDSFVAIAMSNTDKKIETCGLLLGQLDPENDELHIRALCIPRQKGEADSCEMVDEEGIFELQEQRDLLTLGWIHTHPVQTCFLSSVDLHTHCAYQISLPEAIAVVCAPNNNPSVGVFRLTDPPGLGIIMQCTEKGFHPHRASMLYTDADAVSGHVVKTPAPFDLVDLRPLNEQQ